MSGRSLVAAFAIVAVLAATAGYLARRTALEEPAPPLPDGRVAFTLPDLEGKPRSVDEWLGQPLLINFWATWCAPCRREIPLLKEAQAEHGADLQVIGVAVDYLEDVVAYAETAEFNYPILVGQEDAMAAAEDAGVPFIGLPFTIVVAPDGRLIKAHVGEIVATQVADIVEVLARLERGELDVEDARQALGPL